MKPEQRAIRAYKLPNGSCPFKEWRQGIRDVIARKSIDVRIDRAAQGNIGTCENVGDGVFELKIDYGPGYRVYFAYEGNDILLLLVGGDKSTQKKDIKTAKTYWSNYEVQRNESN